MTCLPPTQPPVQTPIAADPAQRASWVNFAKLQQSQRDLLDWLTLPAHGEAPAEYAYLR